MSNYNYGLESDMQSTGASPLRFVLIFIVISALTAALLWWFWPERSEKKTPDAGKSAVEEKVTAESEKNPVAKNSGIPEPKPPKKIEEPLAVAPVVPSSGTLETKKEEPQVGTTPAVKESGDPTDPVIPPKGVITEADRQGADLPAVPVDLQLSEAQTGALKKAQALFDRKDFAGAEKAALQALEGVTEYSAFYRKVWQLLSEVRWQMVLTGKNNPYVISHRIRSGDSLSAIAEKYFTTIEFLRKKNNISGSRIFVGRIIRAVPGDWKIVVSKKYRLLKLYQLRKEGEKLFAVWEVGIGRMGKTPVAEFFIAARMRHPDWYMPDGRVAKYGTPENQLGDYFLKLVPSSAPGRPLQGYGIHGAKDESAVGRSLSNGCVRMLNRDVEKLYYLVPAGCKVSIVEE